MAITLIVFTEAADWQTTRCGAQKPASLPALGRHLLLCLETCCISRRAFISPVSTTRVHLLFLGLAMSLGAPLRYTNTILPVGSQGSCALAGVKLKVGGEQ